MYIRCARQGRKIDKWFTPTMKIEAFLVVNSNIDVATMLREQNVSG